MSFLEKLRNLPENKRKVILWSTLIIASLIMVFLWVRNIWQGVENLKKGALEDKINISPIEQEVKNFQENIEEKIENGQ